MFNLKRGLAKNTQERLEHVDKLKNMYQSKQHSELLNFLYNNLTILDDKASALLTFNSILVTISSIYLVNQSANSTNLPFLVSIMFLFASCIFCMKIIWLHWSSSEDLSDMDKHIETLLAVRYNRTVSYRTAWWFVVIAITILVIFIPLVQLNMI